MAIEKQVWVFAVDARSAPGGTFSSLDLAEAWIRERKLSGVLTAYPVDEGCYDWAMRHGLVTGRARERGGDPGFVASFSSASQEHYHFTDGKRD